MQTRSTQDIPVCYVNAITSDRNYATVLKIQTTLLFHYSGLKMLVKGTPTCYRVLLEPYLDFLRTSITQFLVRLIYWRIFITVGLQFGSNSHTKEGWEQRKGKGGEEKRIQSEGGERGESEGTMCKNEKKGKKIQRKIIHMSRSVWQPEPPFDNVMHAIMSARREGHREMLKNICCCLPQNSTSTPPKNE